MCNGNCKCKSAAARITCSRCHRSSHVNDWVNAGECPNCAVTRDTKEILADEEFDALQSFLDDFPSQIRHFVKELYHYHRDGLVAYYGQPKEWIKNLQFSGYINETMCIALCMAIDNPVPGPADPGRVQ
jgi:hypothetical protein